MKRFVTIVRRLFLAALLVGGVYGAAQTPFLRQPLAARDGFALSAARSWGYQLQNARSDRIAANIDLLVIDAQRPSGMQRVLTRDEVERFRTRPDGRRRIVLAYLSIGEAESYRPYWWSYWRLFGPSWLGPENKDWKGNFRVRFWDAGWRLIILKPSPSLLDRGIDLVWPQRRPALDQILEAGFDGVYLDRVDAFYEWQKERPDAERAMQAFVAEISDYAKRRQPGFLVVPQNAEELLASANYRRKIDGIAKEDLLFGADHSGNANKPDDVAESIRLLNLARADRLPVFLVEYLAAADKRQQAAARARSLGYTLQFADRALQAPPELPPVDASAPASTPLAGPSAQPSAPGAASPPAPARPRGPG
jgi:cysteinyl-tRNA synthetase, unknown class